MNVSVQLKKDIKELINKMSFNLLHDPEVSQNDDRFSVNLFVDEPRTVIGEKGINLRSLQSIFRIMSAKRYGAEIKIDLDVNGYKKKREEFLRDFALSARKRALRGGTNMELEPMNGFDRRVIHSVLSEFDDVNTESTGEYPDRRVVVLIV